MTKEEAIKIDKEAFGSYDTLSHLVAKGLNPHCTCLYCGTEFAKEDIKKQNVLPDADGKNTILCPYCDVDAVVIDHCFDEATKKELFEHLFEPAPEPRQRRKREFENTNQKAVTAKEKS